MKNKEIQEKRIRQYFIDAAKDMLRGEGLRSVSVRSVADRAGYSFATLYNYFRDINDLLFLCVSDFQEECNAYVAGRTKDMAPGKDRLKKAVLSYAEYFTEYPGTFELFFTARGIDLGNRSGTLDVINSSLITACRSDLDYCISHHILSEKRVGEKMYALQSMLTGMLLHYLNRMYPSSYAEFMQSVAGNTEMVLQVD